MSKAPLRVGMVGYGYFARFHLNAWQRLPDVNLAALAETSDERSKAASNDAKGIEVFATVEDMLASGSFDILDVATPPVTHLKLIEPMLGKAPLIICQKPFCETLQQAEQLALAASRSTSKLVIHENFRFMPWYREISRILKDDRLGRVIQAQFKLRPGDGASADAYLDRQPYFRDMKQFLIRETGVHWVDVFRFLFGEPISVFADLFQTNPVIAGEDSGTFVFQQSDGARILFDGNRTLDHAADNLRLTMGEFVVEGSKATLTVSGDGRIKLRDFGSNVWTEHPYDFEDNDFGGDCVFHFQNHVVSHVLNKSPLENEAADYLKNLLIQEKIYRSSTDGVRLMLNSGEGT